MTPKGEIITGYKATDENMKCRDFQFEIGKWYEHDGEIELCKSGFHFCEYPSGPWSYYTEGRMFKIEAEFVQKEDEPGAELKHVAKRIRLVAEIEIGGDSNTGYRNTGYRNTGNCNTGYRNTGNSNTGYRNTGNSNAGNSNTGNMNTGNSNTGSRNTGNRNTGNSNTGYRNTGNMNTGNSNTGDSNTGDRNTGDWNTGDSNFCNYSSGFFNTIDKFYIFDKPCEIDRDSLDLHLIKELGYSLIKDHAFDYSKFASLPNATEEKIKSIHNKMINHRKQMEDKKNG